MEDFFDYILGGFLIVLLGVIGGLIYFALHDPLLAYLLASVVVAVGVGGTTIVMLRIIQRKQIENYYPLLQTCGHEYKEVKNALQKLNRPMRRRLKLLLPKIRRIRKAIRKHIWKVCAIDKTLKTLNQQSDPFPSAQNHYYEHVRAIETSKTQYLAEIHEALQYLHTLQAQLCAIQHAPRNPNEIPHSITETLDELLIEMEALREIE